MTSSSSSSPSSSSPIRRPSFCPFFNLSLIQTQNSKFDFRNYTAPESRPKSGNGDLFMSESEHREHDSELCDGGNGEEDDDDEEEDKEREEGDGNESELEVEVDERQRVVEVRRKGVFGISRDFRNAVKRPFRRTRKRKKEKERGDGEIIKLPAASRRRRGSENGGGCYVCFMRPRTEEECPETPTSDPNSDSFNFEMLRTLIESNDFYCKECNPHI